MLRACGRTMPYLHVSFSWDKDDVARLPVEVRDRMPRDYLEELTGKPANETGHIVVAHAPWELHLLALTADLRTAKRRDIYIHGRDAIAVRAWQKANDAFYGWTDPDAIPPPGKGDLVLEQDTPEHHAAALRFHDLVEQERVNGAIHSRQDAIEFIEAQHECKAVKYTYSKLILTLKNGDEFDLWGKCYSCAYDAQILLAETRALQRREAGALRPAESQIEEREVGGGEQSPPHGALEGEGGTSSCTYFSLGTGTTSSSQGDHGAVSSVERAVPAQLTTQSEIRLTPMKWRFHCECPRPQRILPA